MFWVRTNPAICLHYTRRKGSDSDTMMNKLDSFYYNVIKTVFLLFGLMPGSWRMAIGNTIGQIWFAVDKRHRRMALINLHQAFGKEKSELEIQRLAKKVFQNLARIPFEIAWTYRMDEESYKKLFQIHGLSNLKTAFDRRKGVLFLTAHSGNWELLPSIIRLSGYPSLVVYRPLNFQPADRYLYEYRVRFGVEMVAKKKSMRKIVRTLDQKECVGIVLDQNAGYTAGVFADFLGKPASTSMGLSLAALKYEAPVLPVFLYQEGEKFHVEIGEEIPLIKTGDKEKDVVANTQKYNQAIEAFVRNHPDQWFWVHNRFKDQPKPE